jgi:sugar phosphate isomerase/epimerase
MENRPDDVASLQAWVRGHKVAWEFQPLMEAVKGLGLKRTGLELHLFAECTSAEAEPLADVYERVRRIAEMASPADAGVLVEVMPFDAAERLRPETGYAPEVQVTVCFTPADPSAVETQIEASAGFLERLQATIERKLRDLGLQLRAGGSTRR